MAKLLGVYECRVCGNLVEVLRQGIGELVCCGQPMSFLEEKTEDQGMEKHVPVLERSEEAAKVKVPDPEKPITP